MIKTDRQKRQISTEIFSHIPSELVEIAVEGGYELYAVGGCIRNLLLGRNVGDVDISVVGDAVKLARKISDLLKTGKVAVYSRFGTALVRYKDRNFEFATARAESYLPDSRKPATIETVSIDKDLKRRDFTVNALAFGLTGPRSGELIDLFEGLADLKNHILRTPLEPEVTFCDDPLRMLRGIRFAAELGFHIERDTWLGIRNNLSRLAIVSTERIGEEIWKMLSGSDPVRAMVLLIESGLMEIIMPEVTTMSGVEQVGRHHHKDVLKHSLRVMQNVVENSPDPVVRFSGLLHDIGKPQTKKFLPDQGWTFHGHEVIGARIARKIGRRLRLGKENTNRISKLVHLHMRPINLTSEGVTDSAIRRLMFEAGDDLDDQLILCRADITTANPKLVHRYLANFNEMAHRMEDVEARDKMRSFQSPVRGEEIIDICGVEPGPVVGALKGRIEDAILDGTIPYDYDAAREYLLSIRDSVINADAEELRLEIRSRSRSRSKVNRDFTFPTDERDEK